MDALQRLEATNRAAARALNPISGGSGVVGRVAKVARGAVRTKQGKAMLGIAALGMLASLVGGKDETPITYDSDNYNMR